MWKIAQKDLKIFFSDRRAIILTLLLPIGLITLFAMAFGGVGSSNDNSVPPITLLYSDEDNTPASQHIIANLDSIAGIDMQSSSPDNAKSEIKNGDYIADLIIYKGFQDSITYGNGIAAELIYDQSHAMEVSVLQNVVVGMLSKMKGKRDADATIDAILASTMPAAPAAYKDSLKLQIEQTLNRSATKPEGSVITLTSLVGDEQSNWGLIQAVAGTAVMMLLFSVSAIGAAIIQEKEDGVLRKLLQTPIAPYHILFGKMISSTVISFFQLTVMFIFSWLAFGLNLFQNFPALVIMIFFTAIACASFGVFLASVATSKRQVDALRTIVILFMSAIGGSMIPLYIMPAFMQHIAVISVNYWSIQGFYDIFWRKLGISAIEENIAVLALITCIMLSISVYFYRKNILRIV